MVIKGTLVYGDANLRSIFRDNENMCPVCSGLKCADSRMCRSCSIRFGKFLRKVYGRSVRYARTEVRKR